MARVGMMLCTFQVVAVVVCVVNFHQSDFGKKKRRRIYYNGVFGTTAFRWILLRGWQRKCLLTAPVLVTFNE